MEYRVPYLSKCPVYLSVFLRGIALHKHTIVTLELGLAEVHATIAIKLSEPKG